jgi:hypothetical protein
MSDMEWSLHLNTSLAPHNFGRGMTATRRTPMFYANVMQLSPGQLDGTMNWRLSENSPNKRRTLPSGCGRNNA